jgi:hypothetical protein
MPLPITITRMNDSLLCFRQSCATHLPDTPPRGHDGRRTEEARMAGMVDAVIVGGGHNGLVAASYLARAGRSVLVLERRAEVGGAAVSFRAFEGVDVRLSRYSYLVSLLPKKIIADLGLPIELRRRRISPYTTVDSRGLLVDTGDDRRTAESFATVCGSSRVFEKAEPLPAVPRDRQRDRRLGCACRRDGIGRRLARRGRPRRRSRALDRGGSAGNRPG